MLSGRTGSCWLANAPTTHFPALSGRMACDVVGAIDGWKSPVLLVHGDDDRNVAFQQTTGLVQLLRQRDVHYELVVFPDDTHESMLHSRWLYTLDRMDGFFRRFLGGGVKIMTSQAER